MHITIEPFGAARNLTISGKPEEIDAISCYVNSLFNYGVISNIPEDYMPDKDTTVMVQSDEGRLNNGLTAMSLVALATSPEYAELRREYKGTASGFLSKAKQMARAYIASFERVPTVYTHDRLGKAFTADGNPYELGWTQTLSAE